MLERLSHDKILELRLARPPVNALNPDLIKALHEAVTDVDPDSHSALVLSGQPRMFSAGLDVPELLQLDRDQIAVFWGDFFALLKAIAACPVPVVAAITGHSPAGGAVLSIFCDYRVMASGDYRIGLNEVQVGLAVPGVIQRALARLVGVYRAERLLVAGSMLAPEEAERVGFVDEVVADGAVVERALEWSRNLGKLPPMAMRATRAWARRDLVELFDDPAAVDTSAFTEAWFSEETRATMMALVARLKG